MAKYEVVVDTLTGLDDPSIKFKKLIEERSSDREDGKSYDLEQIHDLGFTLSPKPFNLLLRKRKY